MNGPSTIRLMKQFLKVQSQAMATAIAAVVNMGVLLGWWDLSPDQIAGINTAYASVMIVLRQLFSVTE